MVLEVVEVEAVEVEEPAVEAAGGVEVVKGNATTASTIASTTALAGLARAFDFSAPPSKMLCIRSCAPAGCACAGPGSTPVAEPPEYHWA